ncbi:restriction endonuclease subunit S [Poritiphilus flavus]|uniref:Type I restriction modification DNA specificity domain-containing protein n=1 Tax=Poritiphilus flavus TaxID=2697053 RepID=A0A6L9EJP4_9FLAO|nr:restriction endonuclease subunit S [Poritiphilus flavus]NAS14419.1 hypothetical protein [Poritiphilus flavus]
MNKAFSKYDLPSGWKLTNIDSLALFINGKSFKSSDWKGEGIPIIRIQNLNNKDAKFNYISGNQYVEEKYFVEPGDLLFAWSGTPGTSFGAHIWKGPKAYLNQHIFKVICFSGMSRNFLFYLLNQQVRKFIEKSKGTAGLAHITKRELQSTECFIPPLEEQSRIVNKLEELLSELVHSTSSLTRAQKLLDVYSQALLSSTFDGEISEKWARKHDFDSIEKYHDQVLNEKEERHNEILYLWKVEIEQWNITRKGIKPRKPLRYTASKTDFDIPPSIIPRHWKWIRISDFEELIGSGSTPKGGRSAYTDKGVKFIRSQNVLRNKLHLKDVAHIDDYTHKRMQRSQVHDKDVLINITGASIGRTAFVPEGFGEANVNQHVCIIRICTELVNYKYLTFYLNSPRAQSIIRRINSGATREALTFNQIRNFPFPLAPKEEQEVIVELLESKFSIIENLEKSIQESLAQTEALKQSILKKAFEGNLVEQNSNDEPVSELLERIKTEKKEYQDSRRALKEKQIKRIKKMSKILNIKEILKASSEPVLAKDVWQQSEYKGDIEKFYSELKEIKTSIKQVKEGTQSLLSLRS